MPLYLYLQTHYITAPHSGEIHMDEPQTPSQSGGARTDRAQRSNNQIMAVLSRKRYELAENMGIKASL